MISSTSRYRTAIIQTVTAPDGTTRQEMRIPFPRSQQINYTYYRVLGGDRVDTIAYKFFKNATMWWMIANSNPEIIDWVELPPGTIIRVPNA